MFLALDSGSNGQISRKSEIRFPLSIPTIVIDHHRDNTKYGDVNLIEPDVLSCAEVLTKMLDEADPSLVEPDVTTCLYTGMWSDSGGFTYANVTADTLRLVGKLLEKGADFVQVVNSLTATDWDVAMIAKELGRGGHSRAAAVKINGTVDEAEREFLVVAKRVYPERGEAGE